MGKWQKPSEELIALLQTILEPYEITSRKMFGSIAHFINRNMFAGVFEDTIFLRFSEDLQKKIREKYPDLENFDPMGGRPMREYVTITSEIYENIPELEELISVSFNYVNSLPPKNKK